MIEVELKARLRDPAAVQAKLDASATGEFATYQDTYWDHPGHPLEQAGQELRVRVVETPAGSRVLLTFKDAAVDESGSKPEHEMVVGSADTARAILCGLGYEPVIALSKQCVNYRMSAGGRNFLATMVTVPELAGVFLEVETMASADDLGTALLATRGLLVALGVTEDELATELYTDAVRAKRMAS